MIKHKKDSICNKQHEEECLCCGFKGKGVGVHCYVNSCRGCASFFKRSTTLGLKFRCRRGDFECEIKSGSRMCRFCRLKKCETAGMTLKTKMKTLSESPSEEDNSDRSMSSNLGEFDKILNDALDMQSINSAIKVTSFLKPSNNMSLTNAQFSYKESQLSIEYKQILEDVTSILSGLFIPNIVVSQILNPTCLQRMAICLQQYFSKWKMKPKEEIFINKSIPYSDFIEFRLHSFKMEAELLMILPEFSGLSFNERTLIYRIFWPRFGAFANIELSLQTFGYDDENCMYVLTDSQAIEIGPDNRYPDELFTDDPYDRRRIMRSGFELFITELFRPIKKLKLDQMELSYLILQTLWSHKRRDDLSESTFSMMEKTLKVASDELQNYYIYVKKIDNYSWRLVEITKLLATAAEAASLLNDNCLNAKILGQFGPHKWCSTDSVICPLV